MSDQEKPNQGGSYQRLADGSLRRVEHPADYDGGPGSPDGPSVAASPAKPRAAAKRKPAQPAAAPIVPAASPADVPVIPEPQA